MDSKIHPDQDTLLFYGKLIAQYLGEGVLTLKDGQTWCCSFVAGQLTTGEVLLLCTFQSQYPPLVAMTVDKFEGTTKDGFRLSTGGVVTEINYLPDTPAGQYGTWAGFQVREMLVQIREPTGAKSTHFGVTNLDVGSMSPSSGFGPLSLTNGSDTTELWVRPIKDYGRAMRRIRILKVTDVTCEITRENGKNEDILQLTQVVNNLCYLLSVARGTKIQYIYCDQYDETDRLICRSHYSRVTKAYCPLNLIEADDWKTTKVFIESAYPVYIVKCKAYRLNRGMIDAYLDGKAEYDYLEMRGAKLAVTLEMLREAYQKLSDSSEPIIVEKQFNGLIPCIQKSIRDVLQNAGIGKTLVDVICSEGKILELNRRSFSFVLRRLCKEIHLKAERDINLFIECRNSLIHKGDFYCNTATEEDCKKCRPLPLPLDEFFFLINFLDRVFLKLFAYTGKYINWRSPKNHSIEQL